MYISKFLPPLPSLFFFLEMYIYSKNKQIYTFNFFLILIFKYLIKLLIVLLEISQYEEK